MAHRKPTNTKSLLDAPVAQSSRTVFFASVAAVAAHVLVAAGALTVSASRDRGHEVAALVTKMVEVELEPPPPPPPPPPPVEEPPPPPKPVAKPEPVKEPDPQPPEPTPEPPPQAAPAAAQAAEVLTQEPKDEVLDFGETIVQGDSAQYAGGATQAGGTSAKAVRNTNARAGGIEGGTGTDTSSADRSRPASLAGGSYWDCPFPEEADDEGIDDAVVTLRVRIAVDGTLQDVQVTRDPGAGFGREARRCARDKRWQPARDRAGNAITSHSVISVRFSR